MITRYFVLDPVHVKRYKASLFSDSDVLPISNLKIIPGPILADGRQIVKAELPPYLIKEMAEQCAEYGIDNPLTPEGVMVLDIMMSYAGRNRDEVLARWPELNGTKVIGQDEDGKNIVADKFPVIKWSGED